MTSRIEEDDPRYTAIYRYWRENGKPAVCQMGDGNYMALQDNGKIVFIPQQTIDPYGNTSMNKMNR